MTVYPYQCQACGEVFEVMVAPSEADRRPICPRCQSQRTQKKASCAGSSTSSQSAGDYSGSFASRRRFV